MLSKESLIGILACENSCEKGNKYNELIDYIKQYLFEKKIKYDIDKIGNIYSFKKDKPLFSCHTDSMKFSAVDTTEKAALFIYEKNNKIRATRNSKEAVLGGDDGCGVFILLNLIEKYGDEISFAFFSNEEKGMFGSRSLIKKDVFPYAIILDRKGNDNIICEKNGYGTIEFENELLSIGEGFVSELGYCSDADVIRNNTCCANISCGYYNAHSINEYVIYDDVIKTYNFCEKIIEKLGNKIFEKSDKEFTPYMSDCVYKDFIHLRKFLDEKYSGIIDTKKCFEYFYKSM